MSGKPLFYLDASALIKRYIPEAGTENMLRLFRECADGGLVTSSYTPLEVCSALERLCNSGSLSQETKNHLAYRHISEMKQDFYLSGMSSGLMADSLILLRKYSLRPGDSIHLASALGMKSVTGRETVFVSSDSKLNDAAFAEGLKCIDPATLPEAEWEKALKG